MPQEPKKRHSRQRQGKRRHAIHLSLKNLSTCANCGNKHVTHTVCPECGFYKGTQVKNTKPQQAEPQKPSEDKTASPA